MFDIGFIELLLVAIVSLLVIGPERLPGAIRTGSKWVASVKRSFNSIKLEVERELGTDELQEQLRVESITQGFESNKAQLEALDEQLDSSNIDLLGSLAAFEEKSQAADKEQPS